MTRATCQEYASFLAPLNDANIGLGQVIFLNSNQRHQQDVIVDDDRRTSVREERNIVFEEDESEDEYSDAATTVASYYRDEDIIHLAANEDEISSAEDLAVSDPDEAINSVDPLEAVFLEEESLLPVSGPDHPQVEEPLMSGSYAYMRKQSSWSLSIFISRTSAQGLLARAPSKRCDMGKIFNDD